MIDARWEHGSDLQISFETGTMPQPWTGRPHGFWGSGRGALHALVTWGRERHGWRRILVPSYYCQDVLVPLLPHIGVEIYPHAPTSPSSRPIVAGPSDVVLVATLFGMPPPPVAREGGVVVEDHTHDPLSPWAIESDANYAFASLRKTLPLPDGCVLWSPIGQELPTEPPVKLDHDRSTLDRLTAMTLKHHYLAGEEVDKDEWRDLATRAERAIGRGEISGMSSYSRGRLPTLPASEWRAKRAVNLAAFRAAFGAMSGVTLLDAPFAAILVFESHEQRDEIRDALIRASIYPAVLWPLDDPAVSGITQIDTDLARRMLVIHCDYRYTPADMARVSAELRKSVASREV